MLDTTEELHTLIELTDDNVLADLDECLRSVEDIPTPTDVVDLALMEQGQDPRVADEKLIEDGYVPHRLQQEVHDKMVEYRYTVLVCHRRWGKTVLAIRCCGKQRIHGQAGTLRLYMPIIVSGQISRLALLEGICCTSGRRTKTRRGVVH